MLATGDVSARAGGQGAGDASSREPELRGLADVKSAYEFRRRRWSSGNGRVRCPTPKSTTNRPAGSGNDGYHVSVSVFPSSEPGKVAVRLQNHGNLNLSKLPVPPGRSFNMPSPASRRLKPQPAWLRRLPRSARCSVEQGWQPYGSAGDSMHFEQNAVHLDARVLAPPAQPGKTAINYSAVLISADRRPADAESVQYAESNKQSNLDAFGSPADVAAYYKTALAPAGWEATTENPVSDRFESFMIFRNPARTC